MTSMKDKRQISESTRKATKQYCNSNQYKSRKISFFSLETRAGETSGGGEAGVHPHVDPSCRMSPAIFRWLFVVQSDCV